MNLRALLPLLPYTVTMGDDDHRRDPPHHLHHITFFHDLCTPCVCRRKDGVKT